MMELLGQQSNKFKYSKICFIRFRNTTAALAFGGKVAPRLSAATEEWTGAGAAVTKTITVS
jgi:hypothetical protein